MGFEFETFFYERDRTMFVVSVKNRNVAHYYSYPRNVSTRPMPCNGTSLVHVLLTDCVRNYTRDEHVDEALGPQNVP